MKNIKYQLHMAIAAVVFTALAWTSDPIDGINQLPMYGNAKKCPAQLEADRVFLKYCDTTFENRKEAAKFYVGRGWTAFYKHKLDTAMLRFNQAWLLDSLNAQVYWGFGNLIGMQKKYRASLDFFNRSLRLDPANARTWESAASSYGQLFVQTNDKLYLNLSVNYLKTAIKLEPRTARTYAQLTTAYAYFTQKDSAKKYLAITDKLDKNAVKPNIRTIISGR